MLDPQTTQFDLLLNEETGEFYYKGDKIEIKKDGKEYWQYAVFLDGKRIEKVCGVDISVRAGELPIVSLEIID